MTVYRRIGGLENDPRQGRVVPAVYRRIGGLENFR